MYGSSVSGGPANEGLNRPDSQAQLSQGMLIPWQSNASPSSEESTPLLPGKETRRRTSLTSYGPMILALFAILFVVCNLIMHFTFCPVYPWTMNSVRRSWDSEVAQHDLLRQGWLQEKEEHAATQREWKLQTELHEKEVAHRIQEEGERQEQVRRSWDQERERHAREDEEYDKAVARRMHEEEERQDRVRKVWSEEAREHQRKVARRIEEEEERRGRVRREWALEDEKHRQEYEEMERRENQRRDGERRKWQHEVEDHHRQEEERKRREEEERQRLNMFWGSVSAHTCTSYATREYTAQLMNLPTSWEHRVEACKATQLEINGVSYLPKDCEDKGPGVVFGRWQIDQHEPDCTTFWDSYNNKGCTSPGSGKKYVTHKLENLPENGDWRKFCATTPIRFEQKQFQGAQECFPSVWGVYGQWELDDDNCR